MLGLFRLELFRLWLYMFGIYFMWPIYSSSLEKAAAGSEPSALQS